MESDIEKIKEIFSSKSEFLSSVFGVQFVFRKIVGDYNADKFEDFFMRVSYDIDWNGNLCGNYEKETAEMFAKAFRNSIEKKE